MTDNKVDEVAERRRLVEAGARKLLADGTWPEVVALYSYENPMAPRVHVEEYERLQSIFAAAGLDHLVKFVEIVAFNEQAHNVTMSFKLILRQRVTAEELAKMTAEEMVKFLDTPDILIGSNREVEGAAIWLNNLAETMSAEVPEMIQVIDKIFGQANKYLSIPDEQRTLSEMFERLFSGAAKIVVPPPAKK